jgi:hypothetical protein
MASHPALILFTIALIAAVLRVAQRSTRPLRGAAPPPATMRDTILVVLVLPPHEMSFDVERFFRTAAVPSRVTLGIHDSATRVHCAPSQQNSVRVTGGGTPWLGVAHARAAAAALYRDERYILLIPAGATLVPRWDETLIAMHAAVPDAARAVLTSHCNAPTLTGGDTTPRFLHAERLRGARLTLGSRATAEAPRVDAPALPSLFWSPEFSFCRGAALQHVPLVGVSDPMEVTVNSLRLWTHGYSFFVPSVMVACAPPRAGGTGRRRGASAPELGGLGTVRSLSEYEAYSGVQFRAGVASARARAGVSARPSAEECRSKYGSMRATRHAVTDAHGPLPMHDAFVVD